jgi:hypothetical protein
VAPPPLIREGCELEQLSERIVEVVPRGRSEPGEPP